MGEPMYIPGVDQYLASLWQHWQMRGARPAAQAPLQGEGWLLTLCFRAKLSAWLIFLPFAGVLAGVLVVQEFAPQPQDVFLFEAIASSVFSAMGGCYLLFVYWYRVLLDEQGLRTAPLFASHPAHCLAGHRRIQLHEG